MTASGPPSRLRRAALLLGALVYLLGNVAGPAALHGWFRADPHAPGWSAERPHAPPHDEQACAVCQATSVRALPAPPMVPVLSSAARVPAYAAPAQPSAAPALIRLQARAPPARIA
jgi:hypothetical protein